MQSLFIGSVPRSFSSKTVDLIRRATNLKTPAWTSDGEILNADRMSLSSGIGASGKRFVSFDEPTNSDPAEPEQTFGDDHSRTANRLLVYLDHVVQQRSYLYKDVIQPFVTAKFMDETELNTLYLHRPLTDVVYLMREREWYFPTNAIEESDSRLEALILAVSRAQSRLRQAAEEQLEFDDIVHKFDSLRRILRTWYPTRTFETPTTENGIPYHEDEKFREERERRLNLRETEKYRRLEDRVQKVIH